MDATGGYQCYNPVLGTVVTRTPAMLQRQDEVLLPASFFCWIRLRFLLESTNFFCFNRLLDFLLLKFVLLKSMLIFAVTGFVFCWNRLIFCFNVLLDFFGAEFCFLEPMLIFLLEPASFLLQPCIGVFG